MKSNKEIAINLAETVYAVQSEGDFFYEHLESEYGIPEMFAEKVLADEDYKEIMITLMTADILSDIIYDKDAFISKRKESDDDEFLYHPDDLDYDFRMTDCIKAVHSDKKLRAKFYDEIHEEMPVKKFKVTAKFVSYATIEIDATDVDSALDNARLLDGGDFITDDNDGYMEIETAEEIS